MMSAKKLLLTLALALLLCCPPTLAATRQLRVLSVGNSYSVDAFVYMPFVMRNMAPDINLTLGILYRGSGSLQKHWNGRITLPDGVTQTYYECTGARKWVDCGTYTLEQLTDSTRYQWDIVILQQASNYSRLYGYYQPYLNYLLNYISGRQRKTPLFAWLLTPAYPDGYYNLGSSSSDKMFYDVANCAKRLMEQTTVSILLPGGTAIQNARHTPLDTIGQFGHLSYDGLHLQEGLPCLINCYAATAALLSAIGHDADIGDDYLDVNIDWLRVVGKMDYRGELQMSSLDYPCRLLARQVVNDALAEPYEITFLGWRTAVADLAADRSLPLRIDGRTLTATDDSGAPLTRVAVTDLAGRTVARRLPATLQPGIYVVAAPGYAPRTLLIR